MKFVSFATEAGEGYGIISEGDILRLDQLAGAPKDLKSWLAAHDVDAAPRSGQRISLDAVHLLPPIPNPGKVICVATNFREPANAGKPLPTYPLLFTRFADSITGHGAPLLKPSVSESFDFEGELAVIIGRAGHKIAPAAAMQHVAGYSCFNDGSVRDWQKHSSQFTAGKNFVKTAGFGPWMVGKDDVPDPSALGLRTLVNGVVKQAVSIGQMIFDVSWLIAYISTFTPLRPGDVIVTGTPSGFGSSRTPPEFLMPGDRIEVEISGLGTLVNTVQQDV